MHSGGLGQTVANRPFAAVRGVRNEGRFIPLQESHIYQPKPDHINNLYGYTLPGRSGTFAIVLASL